MRRKYEGEWNGDDPICGRWSIMTAMDFELLINTGLPWTPACERMLRDGFPQEKVQVQLGHSSSQRERGND